MARKGEGQEERKAAFRKVHGPKWFEYTPVWAAYKRGEWPNPVPGVDSAPQALPARSREVKVQEVPPMSNLKFSAAGVTATGLRDNNEDMFYASVPLVVVSDGMGGHAAGEVASKLTVEAIVSHVRSDPTPAGLEASIHTAHRVVLAYGSENRRSRGLGCTVTAGLVFNDFLYVAHVGDTRCTLIEGGHLTQVTSDHNVPGQLLAAGLISREQARVHPAGNVLVNHIGHDPLKVETARVPLRPGQNFLFTSDGVHDDLTDDQVLALVKSLRLMPAKDKARAYVEAALAHGSDDNATCVVLTVGGVN